jgi:hypothetical protein
MVKNAQSRRFPSVLTPDIILCRTSAASCCGSLADVRHLQMHLTTVAVGLTLANTRPGVLQPVSSSWPSR